jgi:cytidylate kinase
MEHYYIDNGLLENYWQGQRRVKIMAREYSGFLVKENQRKKIQESGVKVQPCICISRNIGVGALEIAGILGEMLDLQVLDREIIRKISCSADLSRQSIETFDERYPGKLKEWVGKVIGERIFGMSDYARHLFYVAFFIAHAESAIFVGRGVHLMLPRDRVLAIRFVSFRDRRVKRMAKTLNTDKKKASQLLDQAEKEQQEFFRLVHGKTDAPSREFDAIINLEYINDPEVAARTIRDLFKSRFPDAKCFAS